MKSPVRGLLLFALAFDVANAAHAQEHPGSGYATGGLAVSHQSGVTGEMSQTYVAAPGGTTFGWQVGAGVFANSRLSLEGEFESTGLMSAREPSRYGLTYNEDRRDQCLSVNLRVHPRSGSSSGHFEPLLGFLAVRRQAWSRTDSRDYLSNQLRTGSRYARDLPGGIGFTAGLDFRVGTRRFALLPGFRLRVASVGNDGYSTTYPGGNVSALTISPGVSGRFDF